MTASILLLAYAAAAGTFGGLVLNRTPALRVVPVFGVAAWLGLSASVVVAASLGAVTLLLPWDPVRDAVARTLSVCEHAFAPYATPAGLAGSVLGTLVCAAIVLRLNVTAARQLRSGRRHRRRHLQGIRLLARHDARLGVHILRDDRPVVYCVAGHPSRIVVTSSALATLDDKELAAALSHERAHLRQHHAPLIGAVGLLCRAFPFVPLFAAAKSEVPALVEMAADDAAAHTHGSLAVASALLALAGPDHTDPSVLAASAVAVERRFRRLIQRREPATAMPPVIAAVLVVAAVLAPLGLALLPAVETLVFHVCPRVLHD